MIYETFADYDMSRRMLALPVDPDTGCWEWPGAKTVGYGRGQVPGPPRPRGGGLWGSGRRAA